MSNRAWSFAFSLFLLVAVAHGRASAQAPAPSTPPASPPAPAAAPDEQTGGGTVEIDQSKDDLEREQRELEGAEQPSQEDVVVESQADKEATGRTEEAEKKSKGHGGQVGLRAGFGVPFIFAVRYGDKGIPCDKKGRNLCNRLGSGISEYELSFGLSDGFELTGLFRLGLAKDDIAGKLPIALGFGFRSYTTPKSMFKLYLGLKGIVDITDSDYPGWKSTDFGARGEVGLQLDFVRYLGVWAHLAESIMVLRSFSFTTDFLVGLQVRFP